MSDAVDMVNQLGGELVTYQPYGGTAKTFKAVVERRPTQADSTGGFSYTVKTMELWIPNDATDGMTEIQAGEDRVRFKKNLGDAQESEFTVQKIIQEDVGMLQFDGGMFHVMVQA